LSNTAPPRSNLLVKFRYVELHEFFDLLLLVALAEVDVDGGIILFIVIQTLLSFCPRIRTLLDRVRVRVVDSPQEIGNAPRGILANESVLAVVLAESSIGVFYSFKKASPD